ncbi:hypothetical protein PVT68_07325 [Microbulbifer bruguierae]|uniref:Uncharacterized protein n=1 Tax=Microbulbifer bruguierae TaxID=3029061 RepID=A0ABY8NJ19_9GAMM|nr:hypothetical protein [Microbulbifer bruguierae]WGL18097.1 hypothetical protein PVT68_07325 [Microbulbifer bruguierae]
MDLQRRSALRLLQQQRTQALMQAQSVPLPLAMAVAFAGGFLVQRIFRNPHPRTLLNWYLTWQAL